MILRYAAYEEIAEPIRKAVKSASKMLSMNNVPHAVVGGIAVGTYAPGRSTKDIDILIDSKSSTTVMRIFPEGSPGEAHHGRFSMWKVKHMGVDIDFLFGEGLPKDILSNPTVQDGVPIISQHALTALKIRSGRDKDRKDVVRLLKAQLKQHPEIQASYFANMDDPEGAIEIVYSQVQSIKAIRDYLKKNKLKSFEGDEFTKTFKEYLEEAIIGLNAPDEPNEPEEEEDDIPLKKKPLKQPSSFSFDDDDLDF